MNKSAKKVLLAVGAIFLILQLIPVEKTNPPVTGKIVTDAAVEGILKKSCYDCHSNETQWPWYASIAPVSFLVAHDVEEGREHLNFSRWQSYSPEKQRNLISEMLEEVEKGEMPLYIYTLMHGDAEISETDLKILKKWVEKESGMSDSADLN